MKFIITPAKTIIDSTVFKGKLSGGAGNLLITLLYSATSLPLLIQ
jgi:hypothetical protein